MDSIDKNLLEELRKENIAKGRRQDNKQHCEKILQGIGKFDDSTSQRAVWELFQNARDLSEHACIRIDLSDDYLEFSHKGRSFDFDSLSSLIKQVSSEEKEDPDAAGQFGTGFMTTHKFSRVIELFGSYKIADEVYVSLENDEENGFVIDRSHDDLQGMIDAMTSQLENLDKLYEKNTEKQAKEETKFRYCLNSKERKEAAHKGVQSALKLIPFVMTVNKRIEECTIMVDAKEKYVFRKGEQTVSDGLHTQRIWKNEEFVDVFYLMSEDGKDIIILPLKTGTEAKPMEDVPCQFIYFPLLGTENFAANYVFHSERFYPTEPRDSIVLPDGNSELQGKIDADVEILSSMSSMLFMFLRANVHRISKAVHLASIGFNPTGKGKVTEEYLSKTKEKWVEEFKNIPFFRIGDNHFSISQTDKVKVLSPSIVEFLEKEENKKYLDTIYEYAQRVSALPPRGEILKWSKVIEGWGAESPEWFVSVEDIVNHIDKEKDKVGLIDFIRYLKDSGQEEYLRTKNLIPNREGTLHRISDLRNGKNIPSVLYDVVRPIVSTFSERLIDFQYADLFSETLLYSVSRDDLKKELRDFVEKEESKANPYEECLYDVLNFCMTFPTKNNQNTRNRAMQVLCKMHDVPFNFNYVPYIENVDKEQDMYNVVFDSIVKWQFKQIEINATNDPSWLSKNKDTLFSLLDALSDRIRPTQYQNKMRDYAILPNQNGVLCRADELYVLVDADNIALQDIDDLCSYYENVVHKDIKSQWVDKRFQCFQEYGRHEIKKDLARPIEDALQEDDYRNPVTLDIIKHLDKKDGKNWKEWFPNIDKNKAEIFLHRIKEEQLANVYTLLKDESKIEALAQLAENPHMLQIIEAGENAMQQRAYEERHTAFITKLGHYVESILLDELKGKIDDDVLKVEVDDQQGGQDYIVKLGDRNLYYVEVKSRWCNKDSVEMSALQFKTSVQEKDNYSLCIVDMTWKNKDDISQRTYDDIQECINHTRAVHDIGKQNEWCIASVNESEERPHIGGGYRLVVPQKLIKDSTVTDFDGLLEIIKKKVEAAVHEKTQVANLQTMQRM